MYIETSNKHYHVANATIYSEEVRYELQEPPQKLGKIIKLWNDSGDLCLREDTVSNYQYPRIEENMIILSNTEPVVPDPEPAPAPETPSQPTTEEDMLETILDHEARLAALELGGVVDAKN